jgi:hypothetical protein
MKPIARMVFRGDGPEDGLLMATTIKGHNFFKPNTVYELDEILGVIQLREIGPSMISQPGEGQYINWGHAYYNLQIEFGPVVFLSREEYAKVLAERKPDDDIALPP